MAQDPESSDDPETDRTRQDDLAPRSSARRPHRRSRSTGGQAPRGPRPTGQAAAGWLEAARRARNVYLLSLLSAIDGTLLALGASDRLTTLAGALVVGLTVVAGAGSWVAAREGWGVRASRLDGIAMALLGVVTLAATVASVWLGSTLAQAASLHVIPKAAGILMVVIGAEIAGLRLPRVRGVPLPLGLLGAAGLLEVLAQWTY